MERFAAVPEQPEAKRLLTAALADGPRAHAYLLHGPPGVGKRTAAFAFAAALLGDARRVEARTHPDLYVLEPLGEMIRIDDVRALHHDLHMRPFEGERRVYLILDAQRMNEDAADALLKDLEEPPPYAAIVLVASELGPLPPTILSRCQLVPFRRLSERAVREWVAERAPGAGRGGGTRARSRGGRTTRPRASAARPGRRGTPRGCSSPRARSVYLDPEFEPGAAARRSAGGGRRAAARRRRSGEQAALDGIDLPAREAEQRVRRAQRGAERDELLAGLEALEAWYRDLVVVAAGAEAAAVHADRLDELREDAAPRPRGRRRRSRRGGSRDVARARGVQPQRFPRARGAVRQGRARASPRARTGLETTHGATCRAENGHAARRWRLRRRQTPCPAA